MKRMRTLFSWLAWTLVLAALCVACNKGSGSNGGDTAGSGQPGGTSGAAADAGLQAYKDAGCIKCHGEDGSGGSMAPALKSLSLYWTEGQLQSYLADPPGFAAKDTRLAEQSGKYQMMMPAVPDAQLRQTLAAWLITQ
jgi:hypothetical protein